MVMQTLPQEGPASNGLAEWQILGLAHGPDRVVEGLIVSPLGSSGVRISAGIANVGGFVFNLTAAYDIVNVGANATGSIRVDRLVLRLTWSSGGSVDIAPVIRSETQGGVGGTLFPLFRDRGVGTYEVLLGRWGIAPNSTSISNLVSIGPGPCSMRMAKSIAYTAGSVRSLPGLATSVDTSVGWRQQPVFADVNDSFQVAHSGVYAMGLDVFFTDNGAFSTAGSVVQWARIEASGMDRLARFQLIGSSGGSSFSYTAQAHETSYFAAGTLIRPTVYISDSNVGAVNLDARFKVARVAE